EVGLTVPMLSDSTQRALAEVMPAFGSAGNPVDVTGQFVANPDLLRESVVRLLSDLDVHIGIVWLQLMTAHVDLLVQIFTEIRDRVEKPFIVCWVAAPVEAVQRLRDEGIVVFGAGERAVEAAAALVRHRQLTEVAADQARDTENIDQAVKRTAQAIRGGYSDGVQATTDGTALLQQAGVPMAPVALATNADEAVAAWAGFGRSVVMKIESPDITHKTDIDGVILNLDDEAAIRNGFSKIMARAHTEKPQAHLAGVIVQPMSSGDLELVIGVKRDPAFGMTIMIGLS